MNDYEQKRHDKRLRFEELAEKNKAKAEATLKQARSMADIIPLGQPILIGHHSEGRHRRHLDRIHNTYGKGYALQDKAKYYADKAENIENNTAISSDDPEAVTKLKEKIASAEDNQEKMKAFNKCVRKNDTAGMLALGFSQAMIDEMLKPGRFAGQGFAHFQLTNNNANINRMKQRLTTLERNRQQETKELHFGDITIIDNVEINRLQIIFPGKPSDEVRSQLKRNGFRWSPREGAWQRHRSNWANHEAKDIIEKINKGELK